MQPSTPVHFDVHCRIWDFSQEQRARLYLLQGIYLHSVTQQKLNPYPLGRFVCFIKIQVSFFKLKLVSHQDNPTHSMGLNIHPYFYLYFILFHQILFPCLHDFTPGIQKFLESYFCFPRKVEILERHYTPPVFILHTCITLGKQWEKPTWKEKF